MNFENFDKKQDLNYFLSFFTSYSYVFAETSDRVWSDTEKEEHMNGGSSFYQLMPDKSDDGFFDWYCFTRPNNQFFKTKEMCVLYFVKYYIEWSQKGKPNWKESSM